MQKSITVKERGTIGITEERWGYLSCGADHSQKDSKEAPCNAVLAVTNLACTASESHALRKLCKESFRNRVVEAFECLSTAAPASCCCRDTGPSTVATTICICPAAGAHVSQANSMAGAHLVATRGGSGNSKLLRPGGCTAEAAASSARIGPCRMETAYLQQALSNRHSPRSAQSSCTRGCGG